MNTPEPWTVRHAFRIRFAYEVRLMSERVICRCDREDEAHIIASLLNKESAAAKARG